MRNDMKALLCKTVQKGVVTYIPIYQYDYSN